MFEEATGFDGKVEYDYRVPKLDKDSRLEGKESIGIQEGKGVSRLVLQDVISGAYFEGISSANQAIVLTHNVDLAEKFTSKDLAKNRFKILVKYTKEVDFKVVEVSFIEHSLSDKSCLYCGGKSLTVKVVEKRDAIFHFGEDGSLKAGLSSLPAVKFIHGETELENYDFHCYECGRLMRSLTEDEVSSALKLFK